MQQFSQRDPRWSGKELGWGPPGSTIGLYGCLETDFAMIADDSGHASTPATLDDLFIAKHIFLRDPDGSGDYDLLADNALDVAFDGAYQTTHIAGFDAAAIAAAVPSPDTYAVLWISTASVPTHFVIAASADGKYIVDPWTGKTGTLAGYGGPAAVHKTTLIKHLPTPAPAPAPSPTPLPVPTPVPQTFFYVEDDLEVVVVPPQSDLVGAKAKADELAKASEGHYFVVEDHNEIEVYRAFVAPPPPPAPDPTPAPEPTPAPPPVPAPLPAPPAGHASWLDVLVNLADHEIVALIEYLKEHLAGRSTP